MYEDRPSTALGTEQVPIQAEAPRDDSGFGRDTAAHSRPRCLVDGGASRYGIPATLMYELVDIYFTHITNSVLLLHKATLLQQLAKDQAREHVVLSICASAAKYIYPAGHFDPAQRLCFYPEPANGTDRRHNPEESSDTLLW